MEWERMGFDLSLLVHSILAIAFLIAAGVASASYVRNAITRWQQDEKRGSVKALIQTTANMPPRT